MERATYIWLLWVKHLYKISALLPCIKIEATVHVHKCRLPEFGMYPEWVLGHIINIYRRQGYRSASLLIPLSLSSPPLSLSLKIRIQYVLSILQRCQNEII